jgi:peptidoglycan/LPS O-acetylase OafA/YrhL
MPANILRLAYVCQFLLALAVFLYLWTEIGGQSHLDLMPWYAKLSLLLGLGLFVVLGTVAAVSHERVLNAKTVACLLLALMTIGGMAWVTYYYHLHENDGAAPTEEDNVTANSLPSWSRGRAR